MSLPNSAKFVRNNFIGHPVPPRLSHALRGVLTTRSPGILHRQTFDSRPSAGSRCTYREQNRRAVRFGTADSCRFVPAAEQPAAELTSVRTRALLYCDSETCVLMTRASVGYMGRTLRAILFSGLSAAAVLQAASVGFDQSNLTSDVPGLAANTDPNLVNPWGISFGSSTPFWISDNGTGLSTLYNGAGQPQSLVVTIPPPPGGAPPQLRPGLFSTGLRRILWATNFCLPVRTVRSRASRVGPQHRFA